MLTATGCTPGHDRGTRHLQVSDVKRLLIDVGGVGACSQSSHTGQVSTVTAHSLNDEHTPLGSTGRLLDAITSLMQSVQIKE